MPLRLAQFDGGTPQVGTGNEFQMGASLLGGLMTGYQQGQKNAIENQRRQLLADLGTNPNPDFRQAGLKLLSSGDTQGGTALLTLAEKQREQQQFEDWQKQSAGAFTGGLSSLGQPMQPSAGLPSSPPPSGAYRPQVAFADNEDEVRRLEGSMGTPAQRTTASLMRSGVPANAAAGLSSNIGVESGYSTAARNPGDGRDGSDSIGLAQWNSDRAQRLKAFAQQTGRDWRDPDVQASFVAWELSNTENAAANRMAGAQTPEQAAQAAIGFFRPQGYTASNPMGALSARQRVAGANAAALPLSGDAAPQMASADMPAQNAQEAQFVLPTGESVPRSSIENNPRLQGLMRAYMTAPNERARASIKPMLDMELARVKEEAQANRPTDVQRNFQAAQRDPAFREFLREQRAQTNINMPSAESAYDREIGQMNAKRFGEIQDAGRNAGGVLNTLSVMERAAQNPNFYSGFGGQLKLQADRALASLGLKDANSTSPTEVFNSLANEVVLKKLGGSLGAQVSNTDRDFIQATAPNLSNTREGNLALIDVTRRLAQREQQVAQMAREYAKANRGRLDSGFDDQMAEFSRQNPLFSEADMNRIMGIAQQGRQGQGQAPQAPAAGQVIDGYRFKGGNPADRNSWEKVR